LWIDYLRDLINGINKTRSNRKKGSAIISRLAQIQFSLHKDASLLDQRSRLREEKLLSRCVASLLSLLILRNKLLKFGLVHIFMVEFSHDVSWGCIWLALFRISCLNGAERLRSFPVPFSDH
jgi:hypothetical protein